MPGGAMGLGENLCQVEERVSQACARCGRSPDEVTLIAVSKTRSVAQVREAHRLGLRDLGENRVEELEEKRAALDDLLADDPPRWHLIGHVQSRKARQAAVLADLVHSVDSMRLARRLDRCAGEVDRVLPVLLELNVSGEESKYGFAAETDEQVDALVEEIRDLGSMAHLNVLGLMTMAPIVEDPEMARPVFVRLRAIRDELRARCPWTLWSELSMGMTDDFSVAIEEGATMIRVGRAIFGPATY